jgi:hypothetical protein
VSLASKVRKSGAAQGYELWNRDTRMTPRSTYQRLLGVAGWLVVILILGYLILPAAVVTIAAFNDKAILSFPPQAWSWRWFERALTYPDFRIGVPRSRSSSARCLLL